MPWMVITKAIPATKYRFHSPRFGFLKSLTIPAQKGQTDFVGVPS
jgi:hypothetical protein